MKKTQFDQLVIHDFEEKVFHLPAHSHTYYELVYIHKGSGVHLLNNNKLPYHTGDLFMISPRDQHCFEIIKSTHFTFIKFTDSYFGSHKMNRPDVMMLSSPESMMSNRLLKEVKLKMDEPCMSILRKTVQNIVVTLKQGADEFGFTDESHLSHYFKGLRQVSPQDYKQRQYSESRCYGA